MRIEKMDASIQRNAKALFFITWAALILLLANFAQAAQEVEFNYNGRVKHNGTPFDGTGYFKFALVNQNGQTTFWSNDGTSAAGSEPSDYIASQVIDGFFNVAIGDTLTGMDPLIPTVFNEDERIYLRVWFCHELGGTFQRLNPDRRVVNPALLGQQSFDEDITLYVDAVNGDDANNGLTTDTAKQTIQAAVDLLPARINTNITIRIFPGVYRETVVLTGIAVSPFKSLLLLGDDEWEPASASDPEARITGADTDVSPVPVRDNCIYIENCSGVQIQGIAVDYANLDGLYCMNSSTIIVTYCKASNCIAEGFQAVLSDINFSHCLSTENGLAGFNLLNCITQGLEFVDVTATYNGHKGFAFRATNANMRDCTADNNESGPGTTDAGMYVDRNSFICLKGVCSFSNNQGYGIHLTSNSTIAFSDASGAISNNSLAGLYIEYDASSIGDSSFTITGNSGGNISSSTGNRY
ncbi:right-handed parallel beta-helix repeat-containing protein [Candidatus Sumerlaeota bacterium]|nr:right-handed parallel beta-helix repeat-containing protein [Candidatus Sumerlaeota bacterium]